MDDVAAVSAGYNHTIAVRTDGGLWAWGNNFEGQIGDGTIIDKHRPVKIMDNVMLPSAPAPVSLQGFSSVAPFAEVSTPAAIETSIDARIEHTGDGVYRFVFSGSATGGFNLFSTVFSYDNTTVIEPSLRVLKNDASGNPFSTMQAQDEFGTRTGVNIAAYCLPQNRPVSDELEDVFALYFRIATDAALSADTFRFENDILNSNFGAIIDGAEGLYVWRAADAIAAYGRTEILNAPTVVTNEIRFCAGDGEWRGASNASRRLTPGAEMGPLPVNLHREGYRISGWFTAPNGDGEHRFAHSAANATETLYARWQPVSENFMTGDVIGNGNITSADATMLARFLIGEDIPGFCEIAADINGDGEVTIADVVLLARWLVGHNVTHLISQ
jgi:hypothetical protein